MPTEGQRPGQTNRRRFLGCAAGALGIAAAPTREEPEEVIPLKAVYTTSSQEGLLEVPWVQFKTADQKKDELPPEIRLLTDAGPSNLFLVVGADILTAIRATCSAFFGGGVSRVDRVRLERSWPAAPPATPAAKPKLWFF